MKSKSCLLIVLLVVALPILWIFMWFLISLLPGEEKISFAIFAVFAAGAVVFVWGFRTYRELRILEDTPLIPVRSVAMGLVRVKGKATGEDRLTSPLTNLPCYFYRVQVAKWETSVDIDSQGNTTQTSGWTEYKAKTETRKFYLDDGTGRALVDPQGAKFHLENTFYAEIGPKSRNSRHVDPSLAVPGLSDAELRALLAANPKLMMGAIQSTDGPLVRPADLSPANAATIRIDSSGSYRFTEQCLPADRECTVLGTCAENPSPKDEHDRNLILRGVNEKTFLITTKAEIQEEKKLRRSAVRRVLVGAGIMVAAAAVAIALALAR